MTFETKSQEMSEVVVVIWNRNTRLIILIATASAPVIKTAARPNFFLGVKCKPETAASGITKMYRSVAIFKKPRVLLIIINLASTLLKIKRNIMVVYMTKQLMMPARIAYLIPNLRSKRR